MLSRDIYFISGFLADKYGTGRLARKGISNLVILDVYELATNLLFETSHSLLKIASPASLYEVKTKVPFYIAILDFRVNFDVCGTIEQKSPIEELGEEQMTLTVNNQILLGHVLTVLNISY